MARVTVRSPNGNFTGSRSCAYARHSLRLAKVYGRVGLIRIAQIRDTEHGREQFLQQVQPLRDEVEPLGRQAGDVPTRVRETRDQSHADRVVDVREDDWDRAGRLFHL